MREKSLATLAKYCEDAEDLIYFFFVQSGPTHDVSLRGTVIYFTGIGHSSDNVRLHLHLFNVAGNKVSRFIDPLDPPLFLVISLVCLVNDCKYKIIKSTNGVSLLYRLNHLLKKKMFTNKRERLVQATATIFLVNLSLP